MTRNNLNTAFAVALKKAERQITVKRKEREKASRDLARLNLEIPNLEATIRALKQQLGAAQPASTPAAVPGSPADVVPSIEVTAEMGSVLPSTGDGMPPQQQTPDLDSLPGIGDNA